MLPETFRHSEIGLEIPDFPVRVLEIEIHNVSIYFNWVFGIFVIIFCRKTNVVLGNQNGYETSTIGFV